MVAIKIVNDNNDNKHKNKLNKKPYQRNLIMSFLFHVFSTEYRYIE